MLTRIIIISLCFFSLTKSLEGQTCFQDVTQTLGLEEFYNHQVTGGGVSFCDFTNDGLDDISYASDGTHAPSFYINTGSGFQKSLLIPNLSDIIKTILWVDYDNDGDKDLYYTVYEGHNKLWQNDGSLNFIDITEQVGLPSETRISYGAIWGDVNRDGYLDLYYTSRKIPGTNQTSINRLFISEKGESFKEETYSYGVADPNKLPFCAAFFDYNNDNWLDIYISNDRYLGNELLEHNGSDRYTNVSQTSGAGIDMDAMCVAVGDINNDSYQDIYISNTYSGNALLLNEHNGTFENIAESSETIFNGVAWGTNYVDIDNDGLQDIYTSGIACSDSTLNSAMYINQGNLVFNKETCGLEGDTLSAYSNALGDFNQDGLTDFVVSTTGSNIVLYENQTNNNHNWLKVNLTGIKSNRDAVGAKMFCYTNQVKQLRMKHCGIGFLAQNSSADIFGLGQNTVVDSLEIIWPTGHTDKFYDIDANQELNLIEGQSTGGEIFVDDEISHFFLDPIFTDVHEEIGVDHISAHTNFMGGGCAFTDINNDGFDDLYITAGRLADQLYINQQDGTYANISIESGIAELTDSIYTNGVIAADIDRDGDQDLFIMTTSDHENNLASNMLLINDGQLGFTNEWNSQQKAMSLGACFLDFDQDGLIDLYVVNYVKDIAFTYDENDNVNGFDHDCFENRFYKNLGNGIFQDLSISSGLNDTGCALAVLSSDVNEDGYNDILIANDFGAFIEPNKFYVNNFPEPNFTEISESTNSDLAMYAMGIASADTDLDGDLDYYFTNFGQNGFLVNNGSSFTEAAIEADIDDSYTVDSILSVGWGTAFLDYDNNLYPDLYVANGYVPGPDFLPSQLDNSDVFYTNNQDGTFQKYSSTASGINPGLDNRGMAVSDFDNDGDLDICSVTLRIPNNDSNVRSQFLRNNLENDNRWISLKLEGVVSNLDAIGAHASVYLGDTMLIQEVYGGSSHCSQNSTRLHFGLGHHEVIDSISINWPSPIKNQKLYEIPSNQFLTIKEDTTLFVSTHFIDHSKDIKIFPNPNTGVFSIDFDSKSTSIDGIKMYNLLGEQILEQTNRYDHIELNKKQGVYLILIQLADGSKVTRRVIIH